MKVIVLMVFSFFLIGINSYSQFGEPINLSSGGVLSEGHSIHIADINSDGHLDILAITVNLDQVVWYESLGDGNFEDPIIITEYANSGRSVYAGDIDGDGDIDVFSASNIDNKVAWYENIGDGEFGDQQIISIEAEGASSVYTSDFDGDGDLDILSTSNHDDKIAWYENLGGGLIGDQQVISTEVNEPHDAIGVDIDGDGDNDVVSASRLDDKVAWYENFGDGTFGDQIIISLESDAVYKVYSADLDGDSDMDIISTGLDNNLVWFENDGDGGFGSEMIISAFLEAPRAAYTFDIDSDGDIDVFCASSNDNKIVWFENMGGGVFADEVIISENKSITPRDIHITDVNEDGFYDLVVLSSADNKLSWYENLGGATFSGENIISASPNFPRNIYAADMDNDGDQDVFVASDNDNKISWYENYGSGVFSSQNTISTETQTAYCVYAIDLDNDLDLDVLSASSGDNKIAWYENLGGGLFGEQQIISTDIYQAHYVFGADLDDDANIDVVSVSTDGTISWFQNMGDGTFGDEQIISATPFFGVSAIQVDVDADGDIDVISTYHLDEGKISLHENLGAGVFAAEQIIDDSVPWGRHLDVADFDMDGDLDLASAHDKSVSWYENLGDGTFGEIQTLYAGPNWSLAVSCNDLDQDGDIDISATTYDKTIWFENLGDDEFSSIQIISDELDWASSVFSADLDLDGDYDLISASALDDEIAWYPNLILSPNQIRGELYIDNNENGIRDSAELGMTFTEVISIPDNSFAYTYADGRYFMNVDDELEAVYEILPIDFEYWSITSDSLVYHIAVDEFFDYADSIDFGLYPDTLIDTIAVNIIGGFPRCNSIVNYWLDVKNEGTTLPSGVIHLALHEEIEYVSAEVIPDSIVGQNIYWHYDSLFYFSNESLNLQVLMPDFSFEGDTLVSYLNTSIDSLDGPVFIDSDTLSQILVCGYDPNDKIATPAGIDSMGYIGTDVMQLDYTVRFQNTGTDTAFTIVIKDQLDENLNWTSFTPLASSHEMIIDVAYSGEITFTFENIMLPDSNVNEIASHGFAKYSIQLNEDLAVGTSIYNTAYIYFDANAAIITNTKINTIYDCESIFDSLTINTEVCQGGEILGELPLTLTGTDISWNVLDEITEGEDFNWISDEAGTFDLTITYATDFCVNDTVIELIILPLPIVNFVDIDDELICLDNGEITLVATPIDGVFSGTGVTASEFDPASAGEGEHTLYYSFEDEDGCAGIDSVLITVLDCLNLPVQTQDQITIYPNPFNDFTTINFGNELTENHTIIIHDILGKEIYRNENVKGASLEIKKEQLGVGVYALSLFNSNSEELFSTKLIVE